MVVERDGKHARTPRYDDTEWPALVVSMPAVAMSSEQWANHFERLLEFIRAGRPFGLVIDIRGAPLPSADERRMIAEEVDRQLQQSRGLPCVTAVVLSSALQRGAFKAVTWLKRSPHEMEAFQEVAPAVAWVRDKVRRLKIG